MRTPLSPDGAHVWLVRPEAARDPGLLRAYEALLSDGERAQRARFRFAQGRHQYLLTRALVRTTLSRYADVAPADWVFAPNAYGRPEIVAPRGAPPLRFNLAHTTGCIACLVVLDREAGVDVEAMERAGDLLAIAERFFSPLEAAALRALPAGARRERFFEYWTLKESYIKARGMGLSLPLAHFSFHLAGGPPRISFDPEIPDDPASWHFALLRPTAEHVLAVSLRSPAGRRPLLELRETLPLAGP